MKNPSSFRANGCQWWCILLRLRRLGTCSDLAALTDSGAPLHHSCRQCQRTSVHSCGVSHQCWPSHNFHGPKPGWDWLSMLRCLLWLGAVSTEVGVAKLGWTPSLHCLHPAFGDGGMFSNYIQASYQWPRIAVLTSEAAVPNLVDTCRIM